MRLWLWAHLLQWRLRLYARLLTQLRLRLSVRLLHCLQLALQLHLVRDCRAIGAFKLHQRVARTVIVIGSGRARGTIGRCAALSPMTAWASARASLWSWFQMHL